MDDFELCPAHIACCVCVCAVLFLNECVLRSLLPHANKTYNSILHRLCLFKCTHTHLAFQNIIPCRLPTCAHARARRHVQFAHERHTSGPNCACKSARACNVCAHMRTIYGSRARCSCPSGPIRPRTQSPHAARECARTVQTYARTLNACTYIGCCTRPGADLINMCTIILVLSFRLFNDSLNLLSLQTRTVFHLFCNF